MAPSILLVILAFVSRSLWADIKQRVPPSDMQVQVTAKQFNWEIAYPGPDGKLGTEDDLTMDNDLNVPVGKTIRLVLKSRDVIHSFFIPNLRWRGCSRTRMRTNARRALRTMKRLRGRLHNCPKEKRWRAGLGARSR